MYFHLSQHWLCTSTSRRATTPRQANKMPKVIFSLQAIYNNCEEFHFSSKETVICNQADHEVQQVSPFVTSLQLSTHPKTHILIVVTNQVSRHHRTMPIAYHPLSSTELSAIIMIGMKHLRLLNRMYVSPEHHLTTLLTTCLHKHFPHNIGHMICTIAI